MSIYKKIKINWTYPIQPTSLQIGTVKIYRGTSEFTLDNLLSQTELVSKAYDPSFTEFVDDFELQEDTTYYYMIIVYGDVDSSISAATGLYSIIIPQNKEVSCEGSTPELVATMSITFFDGGSSSFSLSDFPQFPDFSVNYSGYYLSQDLASSLNNLIKSKWVSYLSSNPHIPEDTSEPIIVIEVSPPEEVEFYGSKQKLTFVNTTTADLQFKLTVSETEESLMENVWLQVDEALSTPNIIQEHKPGFGSIISCLSPAP